MSEVNLKEYFQRLDRLLKGNAADEVIHHARHILRYYPRNVEVYRFLGRALVMIGRYDEAEAALRRVLGVLPDDFIANVALGEVFERTNRCEDAIYHLERALDLHPSDKDLLDALRVLYHRCRKTGQLKIQMTAGSVARQHWRAGSPDYAIDTLRSALKTAPDRLDLRLLLAQILWASGREEEAAESALEVVKHLPDSLEANRIMAQLWLKYGRPSDAQRFVNRIESVDPYLAIELVQGTPPPDDAFRIEELDYLRSAQSEAVSARPDWLKDLGAASDMPPAPTTEPQEEQWSTWSSAMLSAAPGSEPSAAPKPEDDLEWLSAFPTVRDQPEDLIPSSPVSDSELNALFSTGGLDAERAPYTPPAPPEPDDPFAWMRDAGIDVDESAVVPDMPLDEPDFDDLFASPASPSAGVQPPIDADPLLWARDAGLELNEPDGVDALSEASAFDDLFDTTDDRLNIEEPEDRPIEQEDAFAWMRGYDTGLTTDTPAPYDPYAPSPTDQDEDDLFSLVPAQPSAGYDPYAAEPQDEDNGTLDWLNATPDARSGDAPAVDAQPQPAEDAPARPPAMRGLTAILNEGNFDWMQQANSTTGAVDDDEWLAQFGAAPAKPVSATETPDWLTDLDPSQSASAGGGNVPAAEVNDDLFAMQPEERSWMSDPERQDDELSLPEEGGEEIDWLNQFSPAENTSPADAPPVTSPAEDDLSWMNLMGMGDGANDGLSFADTLITPDPLERASDMFDVTEEEEEEETIPDWLRDSAPAAIDTSGAGLVADDLDWLKDSSIGEAEDVISAAALNVDLDQLDDLGEMRLYSGGIQSAEDAEFEIEPLEPPSESDEDATIESVPDWLSDIRTTSVPEADLSALPALAVEPAGDEGDLSWLNEAAAEAETQPALPVAAAVDDADEFAWLNEAAAEAEAEPALPVAAAVDDADEFAWLNEAAAEAEAEPALPVAAVDDADEFAWLNDAAAEAEAEPALPVAAVDDADEFAWLNDAAAEAEAEPALPVAAADDADEFAWLNDAAAEAEAEPALPVAAAVDDADEFAWLNDAAAEAEAEPALPVAAVTADASDFDFDDLQPTGVTEVAAQVEDAFVFDGEYQDEDDGTAALFEEEIVLERDENTPDWLNAMVPGLDVDVTAQDYILPDEEFDLVEETPIPIDRSAVGNAEFGWLVRIVEEEVAASQPVRRFAFSRPPAWARPSRPPVSDEDDDFPDWIVDDDVK